MPSAIPCDRRDNRHRCGTRVLRGRRHERAVEMSLRELRSARGAVVQDEWLSAQRADYRTSYSWPLALNTPVIGAINGACVGLGFTTCLYQDIRIASDNARMGLIFTQRGLAIEHGSSWMLPRIVGLARAIGAGGHGQAGGRERGARDGVGQSRRAAGQADGDRARDRVGGSRTNARRSESRRRRR